jgi:hypothetical protein
MNRKISLVVASEERYILLELLLNFELFGVPETVEGKKFVLPFLADL